MKKERKKKYLSVFFFFSYRELSAVSASTAIQCHENKVLICPHKKNYLLDKWNMILLYLQFILYITVDRTVNLLMRTISYWKIYLNSCHEPRVTAFRKVKRSHSQFKLGDCTTRSLTIKYEEQSKSKEHNQLLPKMQCDCPLMLGLIEERVYLQLQWLQHVC